MNICKKLPKHTNRQASAQGVSDHKGRSPLDNTSTLKHLQSMPTQTAIFEQFFETRAMDTNSSNNSSSSYCFLFALCAREALGATGHDDSVGSSTLGSPIFEAIFGAVFPKGKCQMEP